MRAIRIFIWLLLIGTGPRGLAQTLVPPAEPSYGGQAVGEFVPYQAIDPYGSEWTPAAGHEQPIQFATCDPYANGACSQPQSLVLQRPSAAPVDHRKGCFQKIFASGTYIPQFEEDALGIGQLEAGVVFGIPFIRFNTPLLITPRFRVNYLDRPAGLDLPSELYDAEVTFRHLRKFGEGPWSMNAAVTLGHYSDFEANDADAFRVTGQAFAVYEWSPATKWVMGVVYLNREDISVVPALGFIYQPHDHVKFDALLPRPRLSWRLPGVEGERWAYVGGEFGGGLWSIDRPTTVGQDVLNYNDFRVLIGIEKKAPIGSISHQLELGYLFGRELEFRSATPDVRLDDSLFVRLGVKY